MRDHCVEQFWCTFPLTSLLWVSGWCKGQHVGMSSKMLGQCVVYESACWHVQQDAGGMCGVRVGMLACPARCGAVGGVKVSMLACPAKWWGNVWCKGQHVGMSSKMWGNVWCKGQHVGMSSKMLG